MALGACTNIMYLTTVPKAGSNIYWKGVEVAAQYYQAYSVLFF